MNGAASGLRRARRLADRLRRDAAARRAGRRMRDIVAELREAGLAVGSAGDPAHPVVTGSGVAIARLGGGGEDRMVVKLSLDSAAAASLRREDAALRRLHAMPLPPGLRSWIPRPMGALERADGSVARLEQLMDGSPASAAGTLTARQSGQALEAMRMLREAAPRRLADAADVLRLIDDRARVVEEHTGADLGMVVAAGRSAASAIELQLGAVHGDLWGGNILVRDTDGDLSGIIDWDRFADHEPAAVDRLHLAVTERKQADRSEVGEIVALDLGRGLDATAVAELLLYWCWFAAHNVRRYPGLARDRWWVRRNITAVAEVAR